MLLSSSSLTPSDTVTQSHSHTVTQSLRSGHLHVSLLRHCPDLRLVVSGALHQEYLFVGTNWPNTQTIQQLWPDFNCISTKILWLSFYPAPVSSWQSQKWVKNIQLWWAQRYLARPTRPHALLSSRIYKIMNLKSNKFEITKSRIQIKSHFPISTCTVRGQ